MKYWKCEFSSQKTKHPEGEKTVVLYVANKQKGKAAIEAKDLICGAAYEGENGEFFKAPKLEESTKEEFDAFFAGEASEGVSFDDDFDIDFDDDFDFDDETEEKEPEVELAKDCTETQEDVEPVSEEDIPIFATAICLFGQKDEYEEDELKKIEQAIISPESLENHEQRDISLVTEIAIKVLSGDLSKLTEAQVTDVIAAIDSSGLKSSQDEERMFTDGHRVAIGYVQKNQIQKTKAAIYGDNPPVEDVKKAEERQETATIEVSEPFSLMVRVFSVGDKFKSAFLTSVEGSDSHGDLNAAFDKEFNSKENAISFAIGSSIDWFNAIAKNEGHLKGASNASIKLLTEYANNDGSLVERFDSDVSSGGAFDIEVLTVYEKNFDQVDFEGTEEIEQDEEILDFDGEDFDFGESEEIEQSELPGSYTLEQINEIVSALKPGESFGAAGICDSIYRKSAGMSNSELKMFHEDAGYSEWLKTCPVDEERIKPLNLGRAVHTATLEPELYGSTYVTAPAIGNAPQEAQVEKYHAWVKAGRDDKSKDKPTPTTIEKLDKLIAFETEVKESGLTVLTKGEQKKVELMSGSMKAHPSVSHVLSNIKHSEYSIWWISPKSGVLCKCRVDAVIDFDGELWAGDVKTTGDFDNFGKSASEFGYDRQEAHYIEGFTTHFENASNKMLFLVVSSSIMLGRYRCGVKDIPRDWIEEARNEVDKDLSDYKARCESGDFVSIETVDYKWRNK